MTAPVRAAALVMALGLLLAACGGPVTTPTTTPTPAPPATPTPTAVPEAPQVLARAIAQVSAPRTYRFVNEVYSGDTLVERSTGEFVAPDRLRVLREDGEGRVLDRVVVGDTLYLRTGDGGWQSFPYTPSGDQLSPLVRLADQYLGALVDPRVVGQEALDGTAVLHLRGGSDMARKALEFWPEDPPLPPNIPADQQEAAREQFRQEFRRQREWYARGSETVDVWVGVEDGLVRRAVVLTQVPEYQDLGAQVRRITIEFSDYGAPLQVAPPPDAAG